MDRIKNFRYRNLAILVSSILISFFSFAYHPFHEFLLHLGNFGYLGAFIAGFLFVTTFGAAIAGVILLVLAESLSPLELGLIAGLGAVLGDLTIFRYVRNNIVDEIVPIYNHFGGKHLTSVLHTKYFSWTLPVLGALIIASPFPDEIGVSLMGISKMTTNKFIIVSFISNSIGIFLIISFSILVKP